MKATFDDTVDCGYIYLDDRLIGVRGASKKTLQLQVAPAGIFGSLIVDLDVRGRVIGIEVLGVSTIMPALKRLAKESPVQDAPTMARIRHLVTPSGLKIEFTHEKGHWPQQVRIGGKKIELDITRRTICEVTGPTVLDTIKGERQTPIIAHGEAYCSPSDNFEYELGRQYALFEAKKGLTRPQRIEVMETYLGRPGAQPWRLNNAGHLKQSPVAQSIERALTQALAL